MKIKYHDNYSALKELPLFMEMKAKIKMLKKEKKLLQQVISDMIIQTKTHNSSRSHYCNNKDIIDLTEKTCENITYSLEDHKEPDWDYKNIKKEIQTSVKENAIQYKNEIKKEKTISCEICEEQVDEDDIIELNRETDEVKETFSPCVDCFQDNCDQLRKEHWNVDEYIEEEEEVVEEEVVEEEVEETEEEEEVEETEEEEEEEEVMEIEINGKSYYTSNETNGVIYAIDDDEDVGPEVGKFVKGKAVFNK